MIILRKILNGLIQVKNEKGREGAPAALQQWNPQNKSSEGEITVFHFRLQ